MCYCGYISEGPGFNPQLDSNLLFPGFLYSLDLSSVSRWDSANEVIRTFIICQHKHVKRCRDGNVCEAYVIPFLFGSFFTVCHPYIDVHFVFYVTCYYRPR